jgi:hypothetical protein
MSTSRSPEAERPAALDALDDGGERQADDAEHRVPPAALHFVPEDGRDRGELPVADRVALPRGAEDVDVLGEAGELRADVVAEARLVELVVLRPGDDARGHDHGGELFHRGS